MISNNRKHDCFKRVGQYSFELNIRTFSRHMAKSLTVCGLKITRQEQI